MPEFCSRFVVRKNSISAVRSPVQIAKFYPLFISRETQTCIVRNMRRIPEIFPSFFRRLQKNYCATAHFLPSITKILHPPKKVESEWNCSKFPIRKGTKKAEKTGLFRPVFPVKLVETRMAFKRILAGDHTSNRKKPIFSQSFYSFIVLCIHTFLLATNKRFVQTPHRFSLSFFFMFFINFAVGELANKNNPPAACVVKICSSDIHKACTYEKAADLIAFLMFPF